VESIKKQARYRLKQLAGFFKIFLKNSKGIVGLAIVLFFAFLALFGTILSPYHPLQDETLSGDLAAPTWLRYLPPILGGNPDLSENLYVAKDPTFKTEAAFQEWTNTTTPHVSIQYEPNIGGPYGGPGSLLVSFKRTTTGATYGNVTVQIYKEFDYPYSGPPRIFSGTIELSPNGTSTQRQVTRKFFNISAGEFGEVQERTYNISEFDTPVNIKMFIERVGVQKWYLWPTPLAAKSGYLGYRFKGGTTDGTLLEYTGEWFSPKTINSGDPALDFEFRKKYNELGAIRTVFTKSNTPGKYKLGIEITFLDNKKPDKQIDTNLYIDNLGFQLYGSSWGLLGTDMFGRDIFSQLVNGARLSLYVGMLSSVLSVVIGLIVGLIAGYLGKIADEILMRLTDMLLVIPTLPLLIILVAVLGPKLENLIILIGVLGWMGFARLVRSQVLSLKERPFIEAAKAVGAGKTHILTRHILPNVMSLVYVSLATSAPTAITAEAALSFLGFWDPLRISWGRMLSDLFTANAWENWWWIVPPGLCIALLAMAFILLGYALDEVLNPKLRIRR